MSADEYSPSVKSPAAAGDDPPSLPDGDPHQDARQLFEAALDAGRDVRAGRATRTDGWTPDRIANFLHRLAETGIVAEAARFADISKQSAFAFRNSAKGRPFAVAWDAALLRAASSLTETVTSRGINGWAEPVFYQGKICGHRPRYDNHLAMKLIDRLDRRTAAIDRRGAAARLVAEEFEQFVEIVATGGESAVDFIGERLYLARRGVDETDLLERADNYHRCGGGLACEIDVSDLDPADRADWTEQQVERASRSGLLDQLAKDEQEKPDPAGERTRWSGNDPA